MTQSSVPQSNHSASHNPDMPPKPEAGAPPESGRGPKGRFAKGNPGGPGNPFARQVAAFGTPGDVLICLTTSGKSKNVIRALQEAKARQLGTIAFLGRDGGSTVGIADLDLLVKGDSTARVQEAHQLLLHVLCEMIESLLGNR